MKRILLPFLAAVLLLACATGPQVSPQAKAEGEARFAAGKGLLLKVEEQLGLGQGAAKVGMGFLTSQQYADLTQARLDLRDAVMLDPGAAWVPEAMLLAAQALDHGRLQQFPRAIEEYLDVAARFPSTPQGELAARRAQVIKQKFGDPGASPLSR